MIIAPADAIAELFGSAGASDYLGEPVTVAARPGCRAGSRPRVTEPVRLHVPAKRYLCAVEPDYFGRLSAASVRTLSVQGLPPAAGGTRGRPALNADRSCPESTLA